MKNLKFLLVIMIFLVFSGPVLSFAEAKKKFYPSGKLKSEQSYINGKLEGIGKGYYESGKLQWEETYKNGKLEGIAKGYYESGKLQAEANFKNGKKHGTLTVPIFLSLLHTYLMMVGMPTRSLSSETYKYAEAGLSPGHFLTLHFHSIIGCVFEFQDIFLKIRTGSDSTLALK